MDQGRRLKFRCVKYREVRVEGRQVAQLRADEHVPHERHVPRTRRHVTHRETERRVGATIEILDDQLAALVEVPADIAREYVVLLDRHRLIHLSPVDIVLRLWLAHHELVVGRAAGVRRGDRDERAHVRKFAFAAAGSGLKKLGRNQIPQHLAPRVQSLLAQSDAAFTHHRGALRTCFSCHYFLSSR
jgi:hypothetical protein